MTLHIDLTVNGDTIARLAVHNVGRGTIRGYRTYRWEEEHRRDGRSGSVEHHPEAGAAQLAASVLEKFDRAGGVEGER